MLHRTLVIFETARKELGHEVTLTFEEIKSLNTGWEQALIKYARILREKHKIFCANSILPIKPVLPTVDLADLSVRHTTCTGKTTIHVDELRTCYTYYSYYGDSDLKTVVRALFGLLEEKGEYGEPWDWVQVLKMPSQPFRRAFVNEKAKDALVKFGVDFSDNFATIDDYEGHDLNIPEIC